MKSMTFAVLADPTREPRAPGADMPSGFAVLLRFSRFLHAAHDRIATMSLGKALNFTANVVSRTKQEDQRFGAPFQERNLSKYSRGYVKQGRDIHAVSSGRKNAS